jgi:hypothetical protein
MCDRGEKKTVLHRLWSCDAAQDLWNHSTALLNYLVDPKDWQHWSPPDWSQSIFAGPILRRFQSVGRLWSLLRGITLWSMWIARNQCIFNQVRWRPEMVYNLLWSGLLKYGQATLSRTCARIIKDPSATDKALKKFDTEWGRWKSICSRQRMTIGCDHSVMSHFRC